MKHYSGAFPAGLATPRAAARLGHSETIGAMLRRAEAMIAAWDEAAAALCIRDYPAFDAAIIKFRAISRDGGGDSNPQPANNGN